MSKKILFLILAVFMVLAGCSSQNTGNEGNTGSGTSVAPKASKEEKITLRYMSSEATDVAYVNKVVEEYQKINPNVNVEVNILPGTDAFITALKAKFSADDAPDFYSFQVGARTQEFAEAGLILDLKGDPLLQNFNEKDLELVSSNGGIYAAPKNVQAVGTFLNMELFKKYKIEPPTNFTEMLEVNEAFRKNGIEYPIIMAGKDVNIVASPDFQYLSTVVIPNDADYYKKILAGELHFNSPFIEQLFTKYGQLREYMSPDSLGVDADEAIKRLVRGDGAMLMSGTWLLAQIRTYGPDLDLSIIPSTFQDNTEDRVLNVGVTNGYHVASTTEHPEEVKRFLEFMLTPEMGNLYAVETKQISATKGVTAVADPALEALVPWLDSDNKTPHADLIWIPGIKDVMKEVTQKWFLGEDIQTVLNEWEDRHQRLMKENPSFVENFGKE